MESIAPLYLIRRGLYNLQNFFRDWYYRGGRRVVHIALDIFERFDTFFAIKVTARHFFEPLYKDYTIIGRILGVVFRSIRLIIGALVYVLLGIIILILFGFWAAIPLILIFKILQPFFL